MRKRNISFRSLMALMVFILLVAPSIYAKNTATGVSKSEGISSERLARIDAHLTRTVSQQRVKGMVAMIARNGKVVYHKAFGEMDEGKPMQKDAIFRICSMSKPITAVAVMMLYERGLIELNDPIYKFIPEFKDVQVLVKDKAEEKGYKLEPAKRPITIRHLLSHTSGLTYGFWGQPLVSNFYVENKVSDGLSITEGTIAEGVKRLAKCPLLFHPGEGWEYGLSFDVLGYLVEVVSGMPFDRFLQENLFKPLKMKDTFFFVPDEKVPRLAAVYEPKPEGGLAKLERKVVSKGALSATEGLIYDPFYSYQGPKTYFSGGAGLNSTTNDYLRFCQMMLNGGVLDGARILSPTTIELMIGNHMGTLKSWVPAYADEGIRYGLGFMVLIDRYPAALPLPNGSHYWGGFYHTKFYIDPQHKVIGLYFSQIFPTGQVEDVTRKYNVLTQQAIEK
jgi:CubicO group peptidase (beta-lactamase class C family)